MKKLLLVVNPYSGQKKAAKLLPEIIAMFNRADYTVQVYITAGPGDATVEVARVCRDVDLVVCCGGDQLQVRGQRCGLCQYAGAGAPDGAGRLPGGTHSKKRLGNVRL